MCSYRPTLVFCIHWEKGWKKAEVSSLIFIFMPYRFHEIWHSRTSFVLHFCYLLAMCIGVIMHWTNTFLLAKTRNVQGTLGWTHIREFCELIKHSCKLMKLCKWMIVQGTLFMQIPLTGFPLPHSTFIVLWNENWSKSWL